MNPGTQDPPVPPTGGTAALGEVFIEEHFTTRRGRRRRRLVPVDLDAVRAELADPTAIDREDWTRFREAVAAIVGETQFEVWFAPLTLGGVDRSGALTAVGPEATRSWLEWRFAGVIAKASEQTGRLIAIADEAQARAIQAGERAVGTRVSCADLPGRLPRSPARHLAGRSSKPNEEVG